MDIFGNTTKLNKALSDNGLLIRMFGKQHAEKIKLRCDELRVANDLTEIATVPPPRLHGLHGNREGQFAVDITANFRLIFEAYDENDEQTTQREKARTISIIEIEDYH